MIMFKKLVNVPFPPLIFTKNIIFNYKIDLYILKIISNISSTFIYLKNSQPKYNC